MRRGCGAGRSGEFGKKPSTRLSQEPCLGVKVNSKRCAGWPAPAPLEDADISGAERRYTIVERVSSIAGRVITDPQAPVINRESFARIFDGARSLLGWVRTGAPLFHPPRVALRKRRQRWGFFFVSRITTSTASARPRHQC